MVHQTFTISGLTQPITAVHLTDTHFGHARGLAEAQKIARMINEINPDLVFFTGDMFDSRRALHEDIFATFAQIQAPIYFIEGNHDVHVDVEAIKQAMRDHSVTVLENETAQFGELTIIGLNHMAADAQTRNVHVHDMTHTVQSVLEELAPDPNAPTVLLHHSPDGLQHAAAAGVDLFLAGHTHAGQLFPITLLAKQLFTYNRGHYVVNGMDAYICSGTGTFGPVVRVATRSEICVLELVPEK
ncbi:MAG: metallophosphoesterase [Candidatus Peribacteria bacterium]|nr:MAG: metallophosphoesterase [Candidatus Peribacteria bacterium]